MNRAGLVCVGWALKYGRMEVVMKLEALLLLLCIFSSSVPLVVTTTNDALQLELVSVVSRLTQF